MLMMIDNDTLTSFTNSLRLDKPNPQNRPTPTKIGKTRVYTLKSLKILVEHTPDLLCTHLYLVTLALNKINASIIMDKRKTSTSISSSSLLSILSRGIQ
jgi:hypothetical protein